MSIIYDALQKIQKRQEDKRRRLVSPAVRTYSIRIIDILIIALLVLFSGIAIYKYIPSFSFHSKPKPVAAIARPLPPPPPPVQHINQAEFKSKHFLNGVYLSANESFAMINFQQFHVGDMVDGLKIVEINTNNVKLQNKNDTVVIETLS